MPVISSPDALWLTGKEFEARFGFEKPASDDHVIFYCKSGVRSKSAAGLAREANFSSIGEYPGSWKDWVSNEGEQA